MKKHDESLSFDYLISNYIISNLTVRNFAISFSCKIQSNVSDKPVRTAAKYLFSSLIFLSFSIII